MPNPTTPKVVVELECDEAEAVLDCMPRPPVLASELSAVKKLQAALAAQEEVPEEKRCERCGGSGQIPTTHAGLIGGKPQPHPVTSTRRCPDCQQVQERPGELERIASAIELHSAQEISIAPDHAANTATYLRDLSKHLCCGEDFCDRCNGSFGEIGCEHCNPAGHSCPRCGSFDPLKLGEACAEDGVPTDDWHVARIEAVGRGCGECESGVYREGSEWAPCSSCFPADPTQQPAQEGDEAALDRGLDAFCDDYNRKQTEHHTYQYVLRQLASTQPQSTDLQQKIKDLEAEVERVRRHETETAEVALRRIEQLKERLVSDEAVEAGLLTLPELSERWWKELPEQEREHIREELRIQVSAALAAAFPDTEEAA